MTEMLNTIAADGASWTGGAPVANAISASGATWTGGGAGALGAGVLDLGGTATAAAKAAAAAGGMLPLTGGSRGVAGDVMPSGRRGALPSDSRNGGHLMFRH